jgi:hypothetical protein
MARRFATAGFLLGIISMTTACLVETREGYWDRDHHRYWHDHGWHDCDDAHCH